MCNIKAKLKQINQDIFDSSNHQFDFTNFNGYLNSNNELTSIEKVIGLQSFDFKAFVPDETREVYKDLLKSIKDKNGRRKIINLLTRDVLYFGSECERLGKIGISEEYQNLESIINNEFLKIHNSKSETKDGLFDSWQKIKPEITLISCHGSEYGLFLKDENGKCKEYNNSDFYNFFKKRSDYTECVILSSCLSKSLGELIAEYGRNVICINQKVDIGEATKYVYEFLKFLNMYSLQNNQVYENAHNFSLEKLEFESSPDSFSFEFLKANKI